MEKHRLYFILNGLEFAIEILSLSQDSYLLTELGKALGATLGATFTYSMYVGEA